METMIAYCGIICSECPVYLATQADDDKAREDVAKPVVNTVRHGHEASRRQLRWLSPDKRAAHRSLSRLRHQGLWHGEKSKYVRGMRGLCLRAVESFSLHYSARRMLEKLRSKS